MLELTWKLILVVVLVAFFAFGGIVNLLPPKSIVDDFVRWGYPAWFHFLTGTLELATAALLLFPESRQIGAALGCCVMLAAVGTVIFNREYAHAIPGLVVFGLTAVLGWSRWFGFGLIASAAAVGLFAWPQQHAVASSLNPQRTPGDLEVSARWRLSTPWPSVRALASPRISIWRLSQPVSAPAATYMIYGSLIIFVCHDSIATGEPMQTGASQRCQ